MGLIDILVRDGAVDAYLFNEASGAVKDYAGPTLINGTVSGTSTRQHSSVIPGVLGLRLASAAYVDINPDGVDWGTGVAFSCEVWFRGISWTAGQPNFLIGKGSSNTLANGLYVTDTGVLAWYTDNNPVANFDTYNQPTEGVGIAPAAYAPAGTSCHFAITISSGGTSRLFVNGVEKANRYLSASDGYTVHDSAPGGNSNTMRRSNSGTAHRIGAGPYYSSGEVVYGALALYQTVLTPEQVTAHYEAGRRNAVMLGAGYGA